MFAGQKLVVSDRDWPGPDVLFDPLVDWTTARVDGPDWVIWSIIMLAAVAGAFLLGCCACWGMKRMIRLLPRSESEHNGAS